MTSNFMVENRHCCFESMVYWKADNFMSISIVKDPSAGHCFPPMRLCGASWITDGTKYTNAIIDNHAAIICRHHDYDHDNQKGKMKI